MAAGIATAAAVAAELAGLVVPYAQQERLFADQCREANALQDRALQQQHRNFVEQQRFEGALHRRRMALNKELHRSEMSHAAAVARREAVRDVWSQKNQLIQTLMVVDTVMFACAFSLAVEATAPATTGVITLRSYSGATAVALGFLFISIWLALKLQARMSAYDMHRPDRAYACGSRHPEFADFFGCHCARLELAAFVTFWLGTAATIASGALYVACVLLWGLPLRFLAPAWLFVALCALGFKAPAFLNPCLQQNKRSQPKDDDA